MSQTDETLVDDLEFVMREPHGLDNLTDEELDSELDELTTDEEIVHFLKIRSPEARARIYAEVER